MKCHNIFEHSNYEKWPDQVRIFQFSRDDDSPVGYSVLYAYYQGKPSLPSNKSLLFKRLECSVLYITFASDMSLFILLGKWEARHFFVSWNKSSQTWVTFPMAVTTISSQTSELFAQRDSTKVWVVNYRRRVPPPPHNMFPVYFLMQTKRYEKVLIMG